MKPCAFWSVTGSSFTCRSGVRVASADLTRLIDAYAVREVLDGVAARFAAERASDADIAKLRAHVAGQGTVVDPWDPKAYTQSNVDFHMAVMNTAGNASLIAFVPLLRMTSQVLRLRSRCPSTGRAMQSANMVQLSKPSLRAMGRKPSGWRGRIFAPQPRDWRRKCLFGRMKMKHENKTGGAGLLRYGNFIAGEWQDAVGGEHITLRKSFRRQRSCADCARHQG